MTKLQHLLGLIILMTACSESVHYTSQLVPTRTEEITDHRALAKKMLRSAITKIEGGMIAIVIQGEKNPQRLLIHTDKEIGVHQRCQQQHDCLGGVYASVHTTEGKGEILYRVYKTQAMQSACAWVEFYDTPFNNMTPQLQQDILGRVWHWTQACFAS